MSSPKSHVCCIAFVFFITGCKNTDVARESSAWKTFWNFETGEFVGDNIKVKAVVSGRIWRNGRFVVTLHTPEAPYEFFSMWVDAPIEEIKERLNVIEQKSENIRLVVEFTGDVERYGADYTTHPLKDPAFLVKSGGSKILFYQVDGIHFPELKLEGRAGRYR